MTAWFDRLGSLFVGFTMALVVLVLFWPWIERVLR
jgi:hypothetical protein